MKRTVLLLLMAVVLIAAYPAKPSKKGKTTRNIDKVRTEQTDVKRKIKETNKQISANARKTEKELKQLNTLQREIEQNKAKVGELQRALRSDDSLLTIVGDSAKSISADISHLQQTLVQGLRSMQGERSNMSRTALVFSSKNFKEAYRRIRYIGSFADWQRAKRKQLHVQRQKLRSTETRLAQIKAKHTQNARTLETAGATLKTKEKKSATAVANLKKQGSQLKEVLKKQKEREQRLDNELSRLIAAEQARIERERKKAASSGKQQGKPSKNASTAKNTAPQNLAYAEADRALTGSFEQNKGRLLFPVAGAYRLSRGYGHYQHPELRHVQNDNNGIDIEVKGGTPARAVYQGEVTGIIQMGGYNNIVMLRHGAYYTVYTNLVSLKVKKGDTVTSGQTLGSIYGDPENNGYGTMHFEMRNGRKTVNPMEWVR